MLYTELQNKCNLFVRMVYGERIYGTRQHADLIRTYMAGAIDTLMVTESYEESGQLFDIIQFMIPESWIPGPDWQLL